MQIITCNGTMHVFHEDVNDAKFPEEWFISRCWFIVKNMQRYKNDSTVTVDDIHNMSHIWTNIRFLNVQYDASIMQALEKFNISAGTHQSPLTVSQSDS